MSASHLKQEIALLDQAIGPLVEKKERLLRELRETESRTFIEVNNIRRNDVQLSSGEGLPYFGNVFTFIAWLRSQKEVKLWSEWNTQLHYTSKLLAEKFDPTPALWEHVPA